MTPLAWAKLAIVGALAAALFFGGRSCGRQAGDAEVAQLKASHATVLAGIAQKAGRVAELARDAERKQAAAFDAIAKNWEKEKDDAFDEGKRVAAAVRAGDLQLQDRWTCPGSGAAAPVPGAAAGAGGADEGAALRAEGAGAFVQDGREADAWIRELQRVASTCPVMSPP